MWRRGPRSLGCVAAALLCSSVPAQQACEEHCRFGWANLNGTGCERCPEGHGIDLATGDSCEVCPPGRFSNASMTICEDCSAGYTSAIGSSACRACPAGRYSYQGDTTCQECVVGKIAAGPAHASCDSCEPSRQLSNANHTACVCKQGFFDARLYPNLQLVSLVAWQGELVSPTPGPVRAACPPGAPCCVDCTKVICPADVCSLEPKDKTDLGSKDSDVCADNPSDCELKCSVKDSCVQCPGGGGANDAKAYMWPRQDFWVPEPATLTVDPLNGDPAKKRRDSATSLFGVVAVEQCHPVGPRGVCAGLHATAPDPATDDKDDLDDYAACRKDPRQCCRNGRVQSGTVCGECKTVDGVQYRPDPVTSVCERCERADWGGVFLFFLRTTLMAAFFDFKARKINVEEEGGGLAILVFFALQLRLYAKKSENVVVSTVQDLISEFLLLEPAGDPSGSGTCTFNLSPYNYFYFRVFVVPIYQYLLVRGIGKLVDGLVHPSDMQQLVDDTAVNPLSDTGMAAQPSIVDKAKSYLLDHYDSSNLRYLRALPVEEPPQENSRRYATYLWWQGATASLKRKQAGKQNVRGQLQVLVAVYIPITKECVSMIFCRPVPKGDVDDWVSTYDTTEGCFGTPHLVSFAAAWAVLSLFTAGFPLFIYLKMSAMRDSSGAWKPGRFTSLVRLSYVFKDDRRAWQAVVMARQVWLVGWKVVADLLASPENQTLPFAAFNGELDWRWGPFVGILLSVHLQALYSPYALVHDNVLEQSCLLVLLCVIWADVTLATNDGANLVVLMMAVLSIAYLYISQVRGRKIARSIHRADLFAAGGGGEGGSTADAGAVDVTSDEFVVTQTKSISASVQLVGMLTRNRQSKAAQSVANPVSSSESGDSAAAPATLELGAEDIKLLKGELRLSDEEIKQNLQLFATFDVDASGYLTVPELSKMFELGQGVRVSVQTIKQLMADIDEDNDGNISFSEFVQVMVRHTRQRDANEELVESFKIFLESCEESDDSEPASRISGEMIVAVFKKVGIFDAGVTADDPRVQAMLSAAAKDDSGRWRPGMAEDGPQTIPFPAFRQMLYAFGDPMSSSFGISVRKSEVE